MDPTHLLELRDKYAEMLRLRLAHDAHRAEGTDEPDPRRRLSALAARYPGALREIDELPIDVLRARIEVLGEAAEDPARIEPWMRAVWSFHTLTRGALCAKRWLSGRASVDGTTRATFLGEVETLCYADDARAWADALPSVASPPRGRITDLVFPRVAETLGVPEDEARGLVFGASRRARGA